MPEVKWVQKYDLQDGPQPIETGPITFVPVLTLDGLEAWLKDMRSPLCNFRPTPQANRIAIGVYGDLLAQVQAWKDAGK